MPRLEELFIPADNLFYLPEDFYVRTNTEDLIPGRSKKRTTIVKNRGDILDLTQLAGGRARELPKPVTIYGPDGRTPIVIMTAHAEAAEIEDLTLAAWERAEGKVRHGEPLIDTRVIREKRGYVQPEQFDAALRQAVRDRMEQHRRNPISDPPRQGGDRPRGNVYQIGDMHATEKT